MMPFKSTARAHPNIAFVKYWGNKDDALRIPSNGSISMNLGDLITQTTVEFEPSFTADRLLINHSPVSGEGLARVSAFLNIIRDKADNKLHAKVTSETNFPVGAGIASSAAAFAALALAATRAIGLYLSERELSALARRGSGSACRSIPAGFSEWLPGTKDDDSYAISLAQPAHWQLMDFIVIIDTTHKKIGSTSGHAIASTSYLQALRLIDAPRRIEVCRQAIQKKDFYELAEVVELDSNWLHAVMLTSTPPLTYLQPDSLMLLQAVIQWRKSGLPVCYTVDAGANIHIIGTNDKKEEIRQKIHSFSFVKEIIISTPGDGVAIVNDPPGSN